MLGPFLLFDSYCCHKYVPEFNDKLIFEISWHGNDFKDHNLLDRDSIIVNTQEKEKYQCYLPKLSSEKSLEDMPHSALPAEKLLADLFSQKSKCSYRLEPYWTYEVCHGSHVRQFHEEKSFGPEKVNLQEYYLGKKFAGDKSTEQDEIKGETEDKYQEVKTRTIDGRETPYFNVTMENGTPCDIMNNKPRQVDILYICHPTANNEVISVKEVTSCEYEVMVLTRELCRNPAYVVKDDPLRNIKCLPLDGAPSRPKSLVKHETKTLEEQAQVQMSYLSSDSQPHQQPDKTNAPEPSQEPPADFLEGADPRQRHVSEEERKIVTAPDAQLTKDFLYGEYCLQGGSGYWLFEFCNRKHILQFHQDTPQSKTIIYLGFWNEQKHLEWFKDKKKFKTKNYVTHYYSNGDVCDVTGKHRHAEVKLKCMEGQTGQQMSIYMIEPSPCEYVVVIESPILCPFIASADSNGLFVEL